MLSILSPHRAAGVWCWLVRIAALGLALPTVRAESALEATLTTTERRELQREGRLIVDLLQNLHYTDRQFHEIDGREIMDGFIDDLDPEKLLLTQEDLTFLHRRFDRTFKTVYLLKGEFLPVFEIFERVRAQVKEREPWIGSQLDAGFDFSTTEMVSIKKPDTAPADGTERDRRWRLRLKRAVLGEILAGRSPEAASREVRRSYQQWARELGQLTAIEVRARFLERLINLFDPHSGYFSSREANEFKIIMEGAVGGVGIDVEIDNDRCFIDSLAAGGPAETQAVLQVGDELIAVAESEGTWTSLQSSRYTEVIAHLRGKPGTSVRLAYRRGGDGPRQEIEIKREEILLVDQKARGSIALVPGAAGKQWRVGYIELPDFYAAGEAGATSSASRDVRELIEQLKSKQVESLVIDLRRNPGGALTEAVGLSALFLPEGVISVTRGSDGKTNEQAIPKGSPVWNGPLVVLTSRGSASASEIFAGAMRFHRRALVVGDATTFGKGTVQIYIELDRSPAHHGAQLPWGTLRLTGQRFYFPSGVSPQQVGAVSDIQYDDTAGPDFLREKELPHALSADSIALPHVRPAVGDFCVVTPELLGELKENTAKRKRELPEFVLRARRHDLAKKAADRTELSLAVEQRRMEHEAAEKEAAALHHEYQRIAQEVAYSSENIEIAKVQAALGQRRANLRSRCPAGKDPTRGWLEGGRFLFERAGEIREFRFNEMSPGNYVLLGPDLAKTFSAGAERSPDAEAILQALRELKLTKHPNEQTVLHCFAHLRNAPTVSDPELRTRVEALLCEIVRLDPEIGGGRPLLDVGQREAARLAADWATRVSLANAGRTER